MVNDLKEFLEMNFDLCDSEELGLFFWERGGKQFIVNTNDSLPIKERIFEEYLEYANNLVNMKINSNGKRYLEARDFLDCVACLGEKKVKELIKKLAGVEQ